MEFFNGESNERVEWMVRSCLWVFIDLSVLIEPFPSLEENLEIPPDSHFLGYFNFHFDPQEDQESKLCLELIIPRWRPRRAAVKEPSPNKDLCHWNSMGHWRAFQRDLEVIWNEIAT